MIRLFWNFLMIGALSFGGGYGMISLVRETVLSNGWLTESEFLSFIAVSESTPGPLAVNMATFVGSSQGGFWGALVATLGVVLPSFLLLLLIGGINTACPQLTWHLDVGWKVKDAEPSEAALTWNRIVGVVLLVIAGIMILV